LSEGDSARLSVAGDARFRRAGTADRSYAGGLLAFGDRLVAVRGGGWDHPQPPMAHDRDCCVDTCLRIDGF